MKLVSTIHNNNKILYILKNINRFSCEILTIILISLLFYFTNYKRDWSINVDQELTLAYNALLINSGIAQEYYDHPGLITIILLKYLFNIFNFIGLLSISTINQLNNSPSMFRAFSEMLIVEKHLAMYSCMILILITQQALKRVFSKKILVMLLSLSYLFSSGVIEHFINPRTELITFIIFIFSLIFVYKIFIKENNLTPSNYLIALIATFISYKIWLFFSNEVEVLICLISLILFPCTYFLIHRKNGIASISFAAIFLLNLSIINKVQILYYAPLYYSLLAIFLLTNNNIETKKIQDKLYELNVFGILSVIINCLFFISISSNGSIIIILTYIIPINMILYFYWKLTNSPINNLIITFNLSFLFAFSYIFLFVFALMGHNLDYFKYFLGPLSLLKWADNSIISIASTVEVFNIHSFLTGKIYWLYNFFISPLKFIHHNTSSIKILLLSNFLLFIYTFRLLSKKNILLIIYSYFIFYTSILISLLRYSGNNYLIFSECILFFTIIFMLNKISNDKVKVLISFMLLTSIIFNNYEDVLNRLNYQGNNYADICTNDYIPTWQALIDMNQFQIECKKISSGLAR